MRFSINKIEARILEWVAIFFSRDLPDPGIELSFPALVGGFITTVPPWKPQRLYYIGIVD